MGLHGKGGAKMKAHRSVLKILSFVLSAAGLGWFGYVSVPRAQAIPAFSRKYQTSCSTCHNNFPELNDFGVAFKKMS